jgi:hypothetical protein
MFTREQLLFSVTSPQPCSLKEGFRVQLKKIVFLQHLYRRPCLTPQTNKTMQDVLMPISILGSFGTALYYFTKVLTDYILKKKMIEKGYVNEDTQAIFRNQEASGKYGSLKWALLAFFAGVALILIEYVDVRPDSTMPYGIFAVALSVGFFIYYVLVRRDANK